MKFALIHSFMFNWHQTFLLILTHPPPNVATPPSVMVFENVSFLLKALDRVSSCHFFIVDCFESSGSRLGDQVQLSTDAQLCNV